MPSTVENKIISRLGIASVIAITCTLLAFVSARTQPYPYILEDLGKLPGTDGSVGLAINASGQVVGWSNTQPTRAFLYSDGVGMVELPGLPGHEYTLARGINDAGVVVGAGWAPFTMPMVALRWTGGVPEDLGLLSGSAEGYDVNMLGEVVGMSPVDASNTHTFLFTDAEGMVDIGPNFQRVRGYAINDNGQLVGHVWEAVGGASYAYRWTPAGGFERLGGWGAFAVNISGQVAGSMSVGTGYARHLVRFTDGIGTEDLGFLVDGRGTPSSIGGINAQGHIVGRGEPAGDMARAFLYTDQGGMQSLEALIDPALTAEWTLLTAGGINDAGQIVVTASNNVLGESHAVRLTPTTPVGPLAHLAIRPVRVESGESATGWVTLTRPAPPGGARVALSADDPVVVSIPAEVIVPAGVRNGSFEVNTSSVSASTPVVITAEFSGDASSATLEVTPTTPTGITRGARTPIVRLLGAFPNPGSQFTEIRYELFGASSVRLRIHDVKGRLVRTLVDARQTPGLYPVVWDGLDVRGVEAPSGIYFFELRARGFRAAGRLVIVR